MASPAPRLVCQWCRLPVAKPTWWDGLPQCPDPIRCDRRRRKARQDGDAS